MKSGISATAGRIGIAALFVIGWVAEAAVAQDIDDLKGGVVRITAHVDGKVQVGSGFIVRLTKSSAYIVTAAHVIEGDPAPQVAFFPRANELYAAKTLGMEGGDPRGVAALLVTADMPQEARAFAIATKSAIHGGESITVIGFPGLTGTPWMVTSGTIGGRSAGELAFTSVVGGGSSGAPLLLGGRVVGIVMETGSKVSYAVPISTARFAIEGWGVQLTESALALLPKEVVGRDSVTMVLIDDGIFAMGKEKQPVFVSAFYLEKTLRSKRTWREAAKCCLDHGKRLPTEAEWEKAVRLQFIRGDGNTWEWTGDYYQADYPEVRDRDDPRGPGSGESNDEALGDWDLRARQDVEAWMDRICAGSTISSPCSPELRRSEMQTYMEAKMRERPPRVMKRVVRRVPDIRDGAYDSEETQQCFRCAQDARRAAVTGSGE